jgi:uncharacterized membrane protein YeaQ/YmgE (transglycosylase-associated protein family)
MILSVTLWFLFGVAIGLLVAFIAYKNSKDIGSLVLLGIIGALVGGSFGQILNNSQPGFNFVALIIATLGAIVLIGWYKNISPQS